MNKQYHVGTIVNIQHNTFSNVSGTAGGARAEYKNKRLKLESTGSEIHTEAVQQEVGILQCDDGREIGFSVNMPPFFVEGQRTVLFIVDNEIIGGGKVESGQWAVDTLYFGKAAKIQDGRLILFANKICLAICIILAALEIMANVATNQSIFDSAAIVFTGLSILFIVNNLFVKKYFQNRAHKLISENKQWLDSVMHTAKISN